MGFSLSDALPSSARILMYVPRSLRESFNDFYFSHCCFCWCPAFPYTVLSCWSSIGGVQLGVIVAFVAVYCFCYLRTQDKKK